MRYSKRDTDNFEKMLADWYGKERSKNEIIAYLPEVQSINDIIDVSLKKLINKESIFLSNIKRSWNDLIGADIAKFTEPVSIYNGTLYIEVSHPAFLSVLRNSEHSKMMLEKIRNYDKDNCCRTMKFTPAGHYRKKEK